MLKHKYTTVICVSIVILSLIATCGLMYVNRDTGEEVGVKMGYEDRLFDDTVVHTIDIIMADGDWEEFIENARNEEYVSCNLLIDNEAFHNVAIRGKGNSSMSMVEMTEDKRYSFKVEFDHYNSGQNYYGLDKLSLNNLIQDNTCLKDYLSYKMMEFAGAPSPLCSFVQIKVNGDDWGLYLAVEGIEEAFAKRNFGTQYGKIYQPESMGMGGDRKNDEGNFGGMSDMQGEEMQQLRERMDEMMAERQNADGIMPDGEQPMERGGMFGGGAGDVALVYTDDNYDSYSSIFDNAVFDISNADKDRLIKALKELNNGENLENVINIEEVIRYFVVHNFVVSYDSYTGSMMHNYYLYEDDGVLSMIPWDYNLAFGAFSMGGRGGSGTDSATAAVNDPIDTPVSGATLENRPMLGKWLMNEEYKALYHTYFNEFLENYIDSGYFEQELDRIAQLIRPYIETDPTAFCTVEEFDKAAQTLRQFVLLRAESVRGQISGEIPSTAEGQTANPSALVDASMINISDMGSNGMGGGPGGDRGEQNGEGMPAQQFGGGQPPQMPQDNNQNAEGMPAGGPNMRQMGDFRQTGTQTTDGLLPIGICAGIMILAIVMVLFFKRRK